jgi:DnaK suppressor protein
MVEGSARRDDLITMLTDLRRSADARYREALALQVSGEAAGDNEGVHGWKASREGGADLEVLAALDRTLKQIDAALALARAGTYGVCAACAGAIPLARLRAVPFATHCVPCQSRTESGGRRH